MIAHEPMQPRDHSRLLYAHADGVIEHFRFYDFPSLLRSDDLLIYNETRVVKARLRGTRIEGGGAVELLVLGLHPDGSINALARPARRMHAGTRLRFGSIEVEALSPNAFRFPDALDIAQFLEAYGEVPLPPYITPPEHLDTEKAYQPIFAHVPGSVAAPTASLHFTDATLEAIRARGIEMQPLVLTVGLGTFAPVRSERLRDHVMHVEHYDIPRATVAAIARARAQGRRVVAIGTTVMRALEGAAAKTSDGTLREGPGETGIFIKPGYTFRVVDALLTNFHVPRSTLLVLVSTFAGRELIRRAYGEALQFHYRFFSFGDAMLLERVT